jgi:hypothetical protein
MIAIGAEDRWHLQLAQRWIVQYNFYINDQNWGRMFVRICPYLPFAARVCLNQHHWLANRMRCQGIDFKQCSNAFLRCTHPQKLQELADSLTAHDLSSCGQKWLACLTPFFKESERKTCGCQHRLFFSQVEYCDNLIFHRRAALDHLCQRLLDANRTIGQPSKITTIFGRKVTKFYKGKLQTVIEDLQLPNPVIRTHYAHGSLKQYVRDHLCLRTEPATSLTSLPATLSPPPSFIPMCWLLFKFQPPHTLWLRFDTIYANSEPRTWSKNSQNRAAINSVHRAIPFALYSSNSSNPFTPRSLPAYSNLTGLTPNSRTTNEPSWIASIKKS